MPYARCSVCNHPDRAGIEAALNSGVSIREVAKRFTLSPAAIHRHQHHWERERNRVNIAEIAKINGEIRKLHLAQTNARKRRDNDLALQIARELRNWFVLKRKAELASIGSASNSAGEQELTPLEALNIAKGVVESQLYSADVRAWIEQLRARLASREE